jgi:hypothetical protein
MGDFGKKKNDQPLLQASTKPTYKDVVLMVERFFTNHRVKTDPAWFVGHLLEQEGEHESPRLLRVAGKDEINRWEYGYYLRVQDCAIQWVRMDDNDRRTVTAGREDDVYWRGEDMDMFMRVYEETHKMRDMGVDAYRKEALHMMRSLEL